MKPDPNYYTITAIVDVSRRRLRCVAYGNVSKHGLILNTQCASLHAEVSLLSTRLRDVESEKEKYHEQLIVAERRIDRLQSKMVSALNPSSHPPGENSHVVKDEPNETVKASSAEPVTVTPASPSGSVSKVDIVYMVLYLLAFYIDGGCCEWCHSFGQ